MFLLVFRAATILKTSSFVAQVYMKVVCYIYFYARTRYTFFTAFYIECDMQGLQIFDLVLTSLMSSLN